MSDDMLERAYCYWTRSKGNRPFRGNISGFLNVNAYQAGTSMKNLSIPNAYPVLLWPVLKVTAITVDVTKVHFLKVPTSTTRSVMAIVSFH